jgi:transposase
LVQRHTTAQQLAVRARIILAAAAGHNNAQIARRVGVDVDIVRLWRQRWLSFHTVSLEDLSVAERLADAPRPGHPARITADQVRHIVALAGEAPSGAGRPISQWTSRELAEAMRRPGDCRADFPALCCTPVKKNDRQPHLIRYWLTAAADAQFATKVQDICTLYHEAPAFAATGERVVSTDELTGVQALERTHPGLPLVPGKVERREFAYMRHGTCTCIIRRDVTTGQILAPACGPRRTEGDFLAHMQALIATDPLATRWHVVVDNLDIHRSESLVRWVAAASKLEIDLGTKGKDGIVANRQSRAAFLSDPRHRIVFHYTPKHASWLNQIEIWFSILGRKLLKRASCRSREELKQQVLAFIAYYNAAMAKPFKWTYQGKALIV